MAHHNMLSTVIIPGYAEGNEYASGLAQNATSVFSPLWFSAEAVKQPADEAGRARYSGMVLAALSKTVGYSGLVVVSGQVENFEKGKWQCGLGETSLTAVETAVAAGYPAALMHDPLLEGRDLAPYDVINRVGRLERLGLQVVRWIKDLPAVPLTVVTPR